MNIMQRAVLRALGLKELTTMAGGRTYSLTDPEFSTALSRIMGTGTSTGKAVNHTNSMQVSSFWACIRLLSQTTGGLPVATFERDRSNGNLKRIEHDLLSVIAESPNADMDKVGFWTTYAANDAQQGNPMAFIDRRNDGSVISLYPIPTSTVTVGRNKNTGRIEYDVYDRGRWQTYPREKIWHTPGFGFNGLVGLSPLQNAREALSISLTSEEFQARFFANGASPSFIVSVPQWLTEPQREQARKNLEELWGGLDNAHKARLLEGGMKPEAGTMPLQEAQFSELRGFSVYEICRFMGVPPHLVMELERSTNNNIEQQFLEFQMLSIMPYTNRYESSITKWLLKPEERGRIVVKFNLDGLLRADSAARGELIAKFVQNAILSRNEARQLEGKNRVEGAGMDDYTVQLQLVPISMLQPIAERQAKNPVPAVPSKSMDMDFTINMPEHKTNVLAMLPSPDAGDVFVSPPQITVQGSKVSVSPEAPIVNVDTKGVADLVTSMADVLRGLRKSQEEDTEIRKKILERLERDDK